VDIKLKDLLHTPKVQTIFDNITKNDNGSGPTIITLKEMLNNESQYLQDLVFDQDDVDRFVTECDSIAE
jgi:hypothetical protein